MPGLDTWLAEAAGVRSTEHRVRVRKPLASRPGMRVMDENRQLVNFSGNDYLGLASDPEVISALVNGASGHGVGSGASALVSGYHPAHQALEVELAEFLERESVLLCSSGYLANLAVTASLAGRGDLLVQDRLCHASLIDAARLSGAKLARYAHLDLESMQRQLAQECPGHRLLVTDGVFSMDGDTAPLADMSRIAADQGAWLLVDDAHGIGVSGPDGRGSVAESGLGEKEVPVLVGTLGKAFGCSGAFIAGSRDLIEHLVNEARSYIFTTAMPPAVAQAARAALVRVRVDEWRRIKLKELIARFREGARSRGLSLADSGTAIQPLLVGQAQQALRLSQALRDHGFLVVAIRPPTVPEGTSRLRITLSAGHESGQVDALLEALDLCLQKP